MTVKRVIADESVSVDAKWQADQISIQNSGIRTSLLKSVVQRRCDEGEYFDVAAPHVIITELSYRYRDNFDLSYRLSIENSI